MPLVVTSAYSLRSVLPMLTAPAFGGGEVRSFQLTRAYLDRINLLDTDGPSINAVRPLDPDAAADARLVTLRRADVDEMSRSTVTRRARGRGRHGLVTAG